MIITIARQCGCGAVHVGKILSRRLGLVLYTRQMLKDMAGNQGLGDEMDYFFDERPVDNILMAISDYNEAQDEIKHRFSTLFNKIIGTQDCIVIGRCGNSIFSGRNDLVSVFLKGDRTTRIMNTAAEEGISTGDARRCVEETDDHRMMYHKYYTGLTWGNANDYDLCIDSLRLGAEMTADLIMAYAQNTVGHRKNTHKGVQE